MEQRNLKKEDWYNALFAGIVVLIIFVPPIVQELKKKPSNENEQTSELLDTSDLTLCYPQNDLSAALFCQADIFDYQ